MDDHGGMPRVLVSETISERGLSRLREAGHEVEVRLKLTPADLAVAVKGAAALVIRSETQVTAEILEAGTDLVVVGRAGIGLDNVDVAAATRRGVMVVNAPQSNVLSAAEHAMALLLSMARNIPQAHAALTAGFWERTRWAPSCTARCSAWWASAGWAPWSPSGPRPSGCGWWPTTPSSRPTGPGRWGST